MAFKKGAKPGPGRPRGKPNKINAELKEMILGALNAKNGQKYLEKIAETDPRTFCALLGRVLPMTVVGDAAQPIEYQVTIAFRDPNDPQMLGDAASEAPVPGIALNGKALVHSRSS